MLTIEEMTWFGVGVRAKMNLFVLKAEGIEGEICNLANISNRHHFSLHGIRFGFGKSEGTNQTDRGARLVIICVLSCSNIKALNEIPYDSLFGEKLDVVVETLKRIEFFRTAAKVGKNLSFTSPKDIEDIKNALSYLYDEYKVIQGSQPKVICFDTPAGLGLEASAFSPSGGKIKISSSWF